jgi:peptidoglycan glycosyltransferase
VTSRRNIELALLIAAVPVALLVFALVHGDARETFEWYDLIVPAVLFGAYFAAHLAVRYLAPESDPVLLPIVAFLSAIGLAFITRLDPELAASQVVWILIGIGVMVATLAGVRSLERLARYKYTIMLAGLVLLLLPAFIGTEVNGAKLWLRIGGFSFQPAELAKILIVLFLAAYLAERREVLSVSTTKVAGVWLPSAKHLGPLLFMWAISLAVLVLEKDLGSSLLFFGMFLVIIYVATGRPAYVLFGGGLFAIGATAAYFMFAHVQQRIAIWIDPFADPTGQGYQLVQSLFALSAGAMTGVGIGRGYPERIPFVETDFIFSAVGEELGLVGAAAIIIAYLLFCLRGLATAARARSDMAALTAVGLVGVFALQVFVIIGGVTRLIPLTGITLPFMSYGGSSIVANFVLLGLLLRAGDDGTGREVALESSGDAEVLGRYALSQRLGRVGMLTAVLLVLLVLNLTYIQVVAADDLRTHEANNRGLADEIRSPRGAIITADGVVLAESIQEGEFYARQYPQGDLAGHVVGYYSTQYGRTGIEASQNEALIGQREFRTLRDAIESAAGLPVPGRDVVLTIDANVQRAAEQALEGYRGAVVAIDPQTGEVLAMASSPDYDPGTVDGSWEALAADVEAPLFNRAAMSLYPPGSTFKPVTLTGAFGADIADADTAYPGPASLDIGGAPVTNYGGASYGEITLREATAKSVNTVFGQLAVDLGANDLVAQSEAFGFNDEPPLGIPSEASLMPDPAEMTEWETAWAGVGQPVGEHESPPGPQSTALQMALVAAGIGNEGVVMEPRLVGRITDEAGRVLSSPGPRTWRSATDAQTAAEVTDLMVGVVEAGSGRAAAIDGVTVAGKTGTAETGKDTETHAWFIAFAPAVNPKIAVAVVLENAGVGGRVAAPRARQVLEAGLER